MSQLMNTKQPSDPPLSYAFCFTKPFPPSSALNFPPPLPLMPSPHIRQVIISYICTAFPTGEMSAQTLCTGQLNYQEKFAAERWKKGVKVCKQFHLL